MKQNPDFQYIAEILDDYCDIHSDGLVGEPLEYSEDSVREQIGLLKGFSADLEQRKEIPPNEHGKNRYGLDVSYFRSVINRELNKDLTNYKPSELARVFARLSRAADDTVMLEPEFSVDNNAEIKAQAVQGVASELVTAERDNAWQELKEIREAINANPEESTADEVRRVMAQHQSNAVLAERIADLTQLNSALKHEAIEQFKVIEHIARAVDEENDPYACHESVDAIIAERDALTAQVERLRELIIEHVDEWELDSGMWDEAKWHERCLAASESTPAQCLAEIKAQAGRDGFIACIRLAYELKHPPGTIHADYYAKQIRQAAKGE